MDRLKLFRIVTFSYLVNQFALAEGSTDVIRNDIWSVLERSSEIRGIVDQVGRMSTRERVRSIGRFVHLLKTFDPATRRISQPLWVNKVSKCFEDNNDGSSDVVVVDDDNEGAAAAAGVWELEPVSITNGRNVDYYVTVLKGCSIISLDEVFVCARIQHRDRDRLKREASEKYRIWHVHHPHAGVHLYLHYQSAAELCGSRIPDTAALAVIERLRTETSLDTPADDLSACQRLQVLEAVDSSIYVMSFIGMAPGKGHLVLLRAVDNQVHVASFTRSCLGIPLRERDILDEDACVPLRDLLGGPVNVHLDEGQMEALTLPPLRPVPHVTPSGEYGLV